VGLFDFAKKKIILSTFQNDFDKIRTASIDVQISVGSRIFDDVKMINALTLQNLAAIQPQLREKYKYLRNQSLKNGATNELDEDYAYAALMESLVLSLGDESISTKILQDFMGWLSFIGVIQKETQERVILNCPSCNQKVRVPSDKKIEITCPSCDFKWIKFE
jgi:hypothetical protein